MAFLLCLFKLKENMLKRDITYTDFNGNEVTDTFYFNIMKSEIVELEVSYQQGLEQTIRNIIRANDRATLISEFKKIILMAYGEKSEDGRRFKKSMELSEAFSQTNAYDALFMELATDDKAGAEFIKAVLPPEISKMVAEAETTPAPTTAEQIVSNAEQAVASTPPPPPPPADGRPAGISTR